MGMLIWVGAVLIVLAVSGLLTAMAVGEARRTWATIAAQKGLHMEGRLLPRLLGEVDGVAVQATVRLRWPGRDPLPEPVRSLRPYSIVLVSLPNSLPELRLLPRGLGSALRLRDQDRVALPDPNLDRTFRLSGPDAPGLATLFADEEVLRSVRALHAAASGQVRIESGAVWLQTATLEPARLMRLLDLGVGLVQALHVASLSTWRSLAQDRGLRLDARGGRLDLAGTVGRAAVRILVRLGADAQVRIVVEVPGLPAGVRLTAGAGGVGLGDPVLDGRVCAEGDPAVLRGLFAPSARGDLRGELLAVLGPHPGASVGLGVVEVPLVGQSAEPVSAALDAALALSDRLTEPGG